MTSYCMSPNVTPKIQTIDKALAEVQMHAVHSIFCMDLDALLYMNDWSAKHSALCVAVTFHPTVLIYLFIQENTTCT